MLATGQLAEGGEYDVDFDHQFLEAEKKNLPHDLRLQMTSDKKPPENLEVSRKVPIFANDKLKQSL